MRTFAKFISVSLRQRSPYVIQIRTNKNGIFKFDSFENENDDQNNYIEAYYIPIAVCKDKQMKQMQYTVTCSILKRLIASGLSIVPPKYSTDGCA